MIQQFPHVEDLKTLVILSCFPSVLSNLPNDLENLIIVRLYACKDNYKIENLPITLKFFSIIYINPSMGLTEDNIVSNIKLPFCCTFTRGRRLYGGEIFTFEYINDFHDFKNETYIFSMNSIVHERTESLELRKYNIFKMNNTNYLNNTYYINLHNVVNDLKLFTMSLY